jgi:hypothetical protein
VSCVIFYGGDGHTAKDGMHGERGEAAGIDFVCGALNSAVAMSLSLAFLSALGVCLISDSQLLFPRSIPPQKSLSVSVHPQRPSPTSQHTKYLLLTTSSNAETRPKSLSPSRSQSFANLALKWKAPAAHSARADQTRPVCRLPRGTILNVCMPYSTIRFTSE